MACNVQLSVHFQMCSFMCALEYAADCARWNEQLSVRVGICSAVRAYYHCVRLLPANDRAVQCKHPS